MQVTSLSYDLAARQWSGRFPAGDSPRTLVTVFGAPEVAEHPDILVEVARAYPRSHVIGCSTAGEIHNTAVRDQSLAVTVTRFDRTDLQLASIDIATAGTSEKAGEQLGHQLLKKTGLRAVLVLGDGLAVNGVEFARGIGKTVGNSVVVTGGLSADMLAKRSWLTGGGALKQGSAAAVGGYGPNVGSGDGVSGGWT
ncbi:MAG: FIST N-terminal domain-containing protein, partial [Kofleriaceae bacterium]